MNLILLVFAKFPEAGHCKTRLIPAIGAEAAADLHRQMIEHTLAWARELRQCVNVQVEVHVAGPASTLDSEAPADSEFACRRMREMFGSDFCYLPQSGGDLGAKLRHALHTHVHTPQARLVVVGTDCPQLSANVVLAAFRRLEEHDVCFAPATDGGYTLLGLRADDTPDRQRAIFESIPWGTSDVLQVTLQRLAQAHPRTRVSLLRPLSDVDVPADLPVWNARATQTHRPQLSVIIPTLDGEPQLQRAIESAASGSNVEVIVVTAEDTARSVSLAARLGAQLFCAPAGRGHQMNVGAEHAAADWLLFLHSDTYLPSGYFGMATKILQRPEATAGAFRLKIDSPRLGARVVEMGVTARSRWLQSPYGDQALFLRKQQFKELGGFPSAPIMEDIQFVRKLQRHGKIHLAEAAVTTSARRWHAKGFVKTTLINQMMLLGLRLGIAPERLADFYRGRT